MEKCLSVVGKGSEGRGGERREEEREGRAEDQGSLRGRSPSTLRCEKRRREYLQNSPYAKEGGRRKGGRRERKGRRECRGSKSLVQLFSLPPGLPSPNLDTSTWEKVRLGPSHPLEEPSPPF